MASTGMWAETVDYLYPVYNTDGVPTSGIKEWKTGSVDATVVTDAATPVTWGTAGTETWYVVTGTNVTLSKGAICSGNVHLILADGAKLTARGDVKVDDENIFYAGIQVSGDGNSLTIYGQTAQPGQLEATGGKNSAGIGGGILGSGSNITINGGSVTATGGENGAGIGGGYKGYGSGITINSGRVTANGGDHGAGIGGGGEGSGSDIAINGAIVTATGKLGGAGIGAGDGGPAFSNIFVPTTFIVKAGSNKHFTEAVTNTGADLASDFAGKQFVMAMPQIYFIDANGVKYYVVDEAYKHVEVVANDYSGDIVIPGEATYEGVIYNVNGIANEAFKGCTGLTSVTIPGSIGGIGESAFEGCTGLTSITFQQNIDKFGARAFYNCSNLKAITFDHFAGAGSGIDVFTGCTGLRAIYIKGWFFPDRNVSFEGLSGVDRNTPLYVPNPDAPAPSGGTQIWDISSPGVSWDGFTNRQKGDLEKFRRNAIQTLQSGKENVQSEEEKAIVDDCIEVIRNATEDTAMSFVIIEDARNEAWSIINRAIQKIAIAAIEEAMQGETSDYLTGLVQQYIDIINSSTDAYAINNAQNAAVEVLNEVMAAYKTIKAETIGSLGEKQNGPALIVTDQDGKEFIFYSPKSVEYIKVKEEE